MRLRSKLSPVGIIILLTLALPCASATQLNRQPAKLTNPVMEPIRDPLLLAQSLSTREAYLEGVPPELQIALDDESMRRLQFWIDVYSRWTSQQGLIHDADWVERVYEIVDLSFVGRSPEIIEEDDRSLIRSAKGFWQDALRRVHLKQHQPEKLTDEEVRVFFLHSKNPGSTADLKRFIRSAEDKRMRFQQGHRDLFLKAIQRSGRYLPEAEKIFAAHGVPAPISRLPFVESHFQIDARSKVGAAGMWQFMPGTGKLFMDVTAALDERLDPYASTEAAAKLLKSNFELLKSWPLAVVAYNHGPAGMLRAINRLGTRDFLEIMRRYQSPTFGFASQNFFYELMASYYVERHAAALFGPITRDAPEEFVEVGLADYVAWKDLVQVLEISDSELTRFNPAVSKSVREGHLRLPRGMRVRLPGNWGIELGGPREAFWKRYEKLSVAQRHRVQSLAGYVRLVR